MTETKVNPKEQKANQQFDDLRDFAPCPPPTVPFRVQWYRGAPVIPLGVEDWEFFGFASEADFELEKMRLQEREEAAAQAAAEAAQADSLSILENHRPTSNYQVVKGKKLVAKRNKTREQVDDDVRHRFQLVAYVQSVLRSCLPARHPVLNCSVTPVDSSTRIFYSQEDGFDSCRVDRMVHDHNVWICAICSLKVAMGRVLQLYQLGENARKEGFEPYFLTITMSHQVWEKLPEMLDDFKTACKYFWESGTVKRIYKRYFVGRVTATEITRGFGDLSNGWNPHGHIMLIGQKGLANKASEDEKSELEKIQDELSEVFINSLKRIGRNGKEGIALRLEPCRRTEDSFDYLLKYVFEVTLGNVTKHGHGEHMSFFQMVEYARTIPMLREEIDPLIREYYWGTKGHRQLVYSDGLLARFNVQTKTDDELAAEDMSTIKRLLAVVESRQYRKLTHEQKAEVRIKASHNDKEGVCSLLSGLGVYPWDSENEYEAAHNGGMVSDRPEHEQRKRKPKQEQRGKHERKSKRTQHKGK